MYSKNVFYGFKFLEKSVFGDIRNTFTIEIVYSNYIFFFVNKAFAKAHIFT